MRMPRLSVIVAAILCAAAAWGQRGDAHIGYVYPAGGQKGTTFAATIGGQKGTTGVSWPGTSGS